MKDFRWMERAACKGQTKVMFPRYHNDKYYVTEAKKLCSKCPVKKSCLEYALEFPPADLSGIWAGFTSAQLAREQRKRKIKPKRPSIISIHGLPNRSN